MSSSTSPFADPGADVSPSNIAFTCKPALESDDKLWKTLGGEAVVAEYESTQPRSRHLPVHVVRSASCSGWFDRPWEDIALIDWGESFSTEEVRRTLAQPVDLRSPETFFVESFNYRHDLWRTGCVVS